jgi:queuine tRNA-ribosyltransferase
MPSFGFDLLHTDGLARRGRLQTTHGSVETPAFMAVGTQATVKALTPEQLRAAGVQVVLGNTYHLALRPGDEIIASLGGLHRFMNWSGPILTDSGGYQIFSLAANLKLTDASAVFRSHLDGSLFELSPEKAIAIQENLGSDIAMCLDHCPPSPGSPARDVEPAAPPLPDAPSCRGGERVGSEPCEEDRLDASSGGSCGRDLGDSRAVVPSRGTLEEAVRRTIHWAKRCRTAHRRSDQALFGIVQGGLDLELRGRCAEALMALDFPGYALGGFSVGETPEQMMAVLEPAAALLPAARPRYLMGVGRPQDILSGIASGIDLFDCVLPTRNGRNGMAFTGSGPLKLRNSRHKRDDAPLESDCPCPTCQGYSRAYLHHLFLAEEMLGPTLLSLHNLAYYNRLVAGAREAIAADQFAQFRAVSLARWGATL